MAETLRSQADQLRPRYVDGHSVSAGRSSSEIDAALRHLGHAGADLSELCRVLAERLRDSADVYDQAEANASAELDRIARTGRQP